MIDEEDGVAGFFEDLPVLMFVLIGVSSLVLSGTWVAHQTAGRDLEEMTDEVALRCAKGLVESFTSEWGKAPRVASIISKNLSSAVEFDSAVSGFVVSVMCLHPTRAVLASRTMGETSEAKQTGFARVVFNGVDDHGLTQILEVQVIVWRD